ncbi:unnamed protein product [Nippostrongylus brasiliensis]|uniref:Chitin-binding type-2 domain-containing protein n=1 Tax=Nippostrongylus brasiliensis TaxID=27835 RepID=A0A0N4XD26_NIPBR|nr:unnamed protein product [Nippostrongylus brasiliensis]
MVKIRHKTTIKVAQGIRDNARTSPGSDAQDPRPSPVVSMRGLPREERPRLKKLVRIGTLNVGTLTGKSREVADLMKRKNIQILCLQETRWKGEKAKEIGEGVKLFYKGNDGKRNGVGIAVSEALEDSVSAEESGVKMRMYTTQHKPLVADLSITLPPKQKVKTEPRIRWWKLRGSERNELRSRVMAAGLPDPNGAVNDTWQQAESSGVDGYRRVEHDCSKYYQCVHGKWLERPCAPGTVFNERISVCDHQANVPECGGY